MTATTTPTIITTTILRAEGFSCPSCVAKIEKAVDKLPGVQSVKVHFASSRIETRHDTALTSVDDIIVAVKKVGYVAYPSAF